MNVNHAHDEELKVTFFPPLYLQRRIWVLNMLRQHGVTSILDIGCGEGELLNCLCQPAPWLPPHPDHRHIAAAKTELINIHPVRVVGLDVAEDALEFASQGITPSFQGITRWEHLEASVWKGGLESLNEQFIDMECIIAMEVIEHLPEHTLSEFAPVILGVYHPRLLLLTTPSYTFNARFTAPDAPPSARVGYLDPTGRTTRVFRHHDHKFEWTIDEFEQWCHANAKEWGYSVEISSVGRATEQDEWGRDEDLGGASQVATFTRLEGDETAQMRSTKSRDVVERASARSKHQLLSTQSHDAHPSSRKPTSPQEIGEAVKLKMETNREAFMRLEELWFEQDIAVLCGGWIELLVNAVEENEKLTLHKDETQRRSWRVELTDGVENPRNFWPSEDENNSPGYIPPDDLPDDQPNSFLSETESSGIDGDISADNSGDEDDGEEFWGTAIHSAVEFGVAGWSRLPHLEGDAIDPGSTESEGEEVWRGGERNDKQRDSRSDSSREWSSARSTED